MVSRVQGSLGDVAVRRPRPRPKRQHLVPTRQPQHDHLAVSTIAVGEGVNPYPLPWAPAATFMRSASKSSHLASGLRTELCLERGVSSFQALDLSPPPTQTKKPRSSPATRSRQVRRLTCLRERRFAGSLRSHPGQQQAVLPLTRCARPLAAAALVTVGAGRSELGLFGRSVLAYLDSDEHRWSGGAYPRILGPLTGHLFKSASRRSAYRRRRVSFLVV